MELGLLCSCNKEAMAIYSANNDVYNGGEILIVVMDD